MSNRSGNISEIDRERIDRQGANAQEETAAAISASGNQTESQNDTEESNVEEKSPKISNPRWEDESGRTINKAMVGGEVYLCADTENIADGAGAKIRIIEKDDDGNDDFVVELSTSVKEGKIRCKWKVVYTEDNDDTDSQQEMEEKGYTLPEYAFTLDCDGIESKESGQLDVMGWIKKQIVYRYTNKPMINLPYKLFTTNGKLIFEGKSDNSGYISVENIKIGRYKLCLGENDGL